MAKDKINKKFYILAWVLFVVSFLIKEIYPVYSTILSEGINLSILLDLIILIVKDLVIGLFMSYLLYTIAFRRRSAYISNKDFVTLMFFVYAISNTVWGIINCFSIMLPTISFFEGIVTDLCIIPVGVYLVFFLVICKHYKPNPVEKYYSFRKIFTLYFILVGIFVILGSASVILAKTSVGDLLNEMLAMYGFQLAFTDLIFIISIIEVAMYIVLVATTIGIDTYLKKKVKDYRDPEKRTEYYMNLDKEREKNAFHQEETTNYRKGDENYDFQGYGMRSERDSYKSSKEEKVFDEFDI